MDIFKDTHIKLDLKRYPNRIFFFKEDICWMGYHWENGYFGCRYEDFWEVLTMENNLNYREVQAFIKDWVEQHFKLKGVTPTKGVVANCFWVEQHFKLKGCYTYQPYSSPA